jgi:hypothetical protein
MSSGRSSPGVEPSKRGVATPHRFLRRARRTSAAEFGPAVALDSWLKFPGALYPGPEGWRVDCREPVERGLDLLVVRTEPARVDETGGDERAYVGAEDGVLVGDEFEVDVDGGCAPAEEDGGGAACQVADSLLLCRGVEGAEEFADSAARSKLPRRRTSPL